MLKYKIIYAALNTALLRAGAAAQPQYRARVDICFVISLWLVVLF
jgi:hypothetical protein